MRPKTTPFRTTLTLLLTAAFATATMATTTGAVLASAGDATLNRVHTSAGAALRAGDVLRTSPEGFSKVTLGAASFDIGHATSATVEANGLRLETGFVRAHGITVIQQDRVTATGATASTDFEMTALGGGRVYIHAYTGSVQIAGLAKPTTMGPNSAITYDTAIPQAQAGGAPAAAGGAIGVSASVIAVAAAVAVSVVAGVVAYAAISNSSPTTP